MSGLIFFESCFLFFSYEELLLRTSGNVLPQITLALTKILKQRQKKKWFLNLVLSFRRWIQEDPEEFDNTENLLEQRNEDMNNRNPPRTCNT